MRRRQMKKKIMSLALLTATVFGLAACGNGGGNNSTAKTDVNNLPIATSNKGAAKANGEMNVAVVMDTQFKGIFSPEFYSDNYDYKFMEPALEPLFQQNTDFEIVDGGAANLKLDKDAKTATVTLRDNIKWSDGQEVTADDLIFPYEVIGHKDYTGIRYDDSFINIVGMEEYHNGSADSISGIKKLNDKSIEITFKEMNPGIQQAGGGVWSYAMPKHAFEGIAVKDMESSDPVRKHPLFFGPYKMDNIVTGESVTYSPNENYYDGTPKLAKLTLKAVPTASIVKALESKQYDMALSMPTDIYTTYQNLDGYENLGRPEQSYSYIGFKMGKWNADKGSVEYNPEAKMSDKSLRQAMGYALDNTVVGEEFYKGLRSAANALIPPIFPTFHDSKIKGYTLDLDKAKKLLDDAGYKDVDGDGMREDKNGNKLTINFAAMSGGETAQSLADYYVQQWNAIGLNVQYTTGRLLDFQSFYDKLKNDDPEIDVYSGAWGVGSDPSPTGLYGPNSAFNYPRFESKENTELLAAIDSDASFDPKVRKENFDKWQEYAADEAFVIPTLYRNEVLPVSKKVTGWDWAYGEGHTTWSTVGVTE